MKYFLDTEFLEDGRRLELMSIGVVCEDGREYYAAVYDANWSLIMRDKWLRENVVPLLPIALSRHESPNGWNYGRWERLISPTWKTREQIAKELIEFVTGEDTEFWAYYGDYDWVATCRLFGRMIDLPKGWPKLCLDLRQWLNHKGLRTVRQPDDAPHHALEDARWVAGCHRANAPQGDAPDHEWQGRYKKLFQEFNETQYTQQKRISELEAIIEEQDIRVDS